MSKKRLLSKIDKYLAEHRKSDGGGWAEITDEDVKLLDDIIDDLIQLKCDKDADGDYPINWSLVNRRVEHWVVRPQSVKYEPDWYDIRSASYEIETINSWIRNQTDSLLRPIMEQKKLDKS